MDELESSPASQSFFHQPRVRLIGLIFIIVLIGLGAWMWMHNRQKITTSDSTNQTTSAGTTASEKVLKIPKINQQPDADNDRLPDSDEQTLGTNPNSPDSDQDGLFDYEEVNVWKTNPLKGDTDGDGIPDGLEVQNGTNPLGSGRFLDINAAITNTTR